MPSQKQVSDTSLSTGKIFEWFTHLTWPKMIISVVAAAMMLTIFTLYENRQRVFDHSATRGYISDFELQKPTKEGAEIFKAYLKLHPEVTYISLMDANPITNKRSVVTRYFNDKEIQNIIESQVRENPTMGDGPLLTADPNLNKQVLAILAGEFYCDPAKAGVITRIFPEVAKRLTYSCRVPLPPAFNKATGWITLHLNEWPLTDIEKFKIDALTLSLAYYNQDILKQEIRSSQ